MANTENEIELKKQLLFNTRFFPIYNDIMFKLSIYLADNVETPQEVKEELFFADRHLVMKNDLNLLECVEMHDELYTFVKKWILELSRLRDIDDWGVHRSRIVTRFRSIEPMVETFLDIEDHLQDKFKKLSNQFPSPTKDFLNQAINSLVRIGYETKKYENRKWQYKNDKLHWAYWNNMVLYNNKDFQNIIISKEEIKFLNKLLKDKTNDEWYRDRGLSIYIDNTLPEIENTITEIERLKSQRDLINGINDNETGIWNKVKKVIKL